MNLGLSSLGVVPVGVRRRLARWLVPGAVRPAISRVLLLLVVLEAGIRFVSLAAGPFPLFRDSAVYWELGRRVAAGDVFLLRPLSSFRPPMYPWFLGVMQWALGEWALECVVVVQNLLGIGTSLLAARVAMRISGSAASIPLAYLLMLMTPGRMQFDQMVMCESLFGFFLALHANFVVEWLERRTARTGVAAGVTLALATLTRATSQALWVAAVALYVWSALHHRRVRAERRWGALLAMVASMALALAPWYVRNIAAERKVFLTHALGVNLWIGAFSEEGAHLDLVDSAARSSLDGIRWRHGWSVLGRLRQLGLSEGEADGWMTQQALRSIESSPAAYAGSVARNFLLYWGCREEAIPWYFRPPVGGSSQYAGQHIWASRRISDSLGPLMRFLFRYPSTFLFAMGVAAILASLLLAYGGASRLGGWWLLLAILYFPIVTVVVIFPLYRYRAPLEALIAAAIGAGVVTCNRLVRAARRRAGFESKPGEPSVSPRLLVVATHPVQYQAPFFRALSSRREVALKVLYAHIPTSFQQGLGFGRAITWDVDLFSGYEWSLLEGVTVRGEALGGGRALSITGIRDQLEAAGADAVLIPGWHSRVLVQAEKAAAALRWPILVRGEANDLRRGSLLRGAVLRWRLRRVSALLAIGRANRRLYRSVGFPSEGIFNAPYGVDNERFAAAADAERPARAGIRQRFGLSSNAFCLLFAGKLEAKKRPWDLLKALDLLLDHRLNVELLVVGSGGLEEDLRSLSIERRLPVCFTGFLNQTEIPQAYAAADALVLPSEAGETWGLVVNEAMASGLPAVVSDRVGCREDLVIEGETGYSYPMGEIRELADRLVRLASHPRRAAEMGKNARRRVFAEFSIEKAVEGTLNALDYAVSGRARR